MTWSPYSRFHGSSPAFGGLNLAHGRRTDDDPSLAKNFVLSRKTCWPHARKPTLVSYHPSSILHEDFRQTVRPHRSFCDNPVHGQALDNAASRNIDFAARQGPQTSRWWPIMFGGCSNGKARRRVRGDLRTAAMGPSAAVYVNRFGGDVRTFGKLLPDTSRKIASTLLELPPRRWRRAALSRDATHPGGSARAGGNKKLPVDIIATRIFPFLVEDEDRDDETVEGAIRASNRLLRTEYEMFRNINLDAVRNWQGTERIFAKFIMDFASSYDQNIAIHAVYIIHTLWWRLNEDGEDANDMLREVSGGTRPVRRRRCDSPKPRSCSAPARSSWRRLSTTRPSTQTSTPYFGALDRSCASPTWEITSRAASAGVSLLRRPTTCWRSTII